MKILGLNISLAKKKSVPQIVNLNGSPAINFKGKYYPVDNRGGWYPYLPYVQEHYGGAWQNNDDWTIDTVLAFHAVYACIALIAGDIAKLRIGLVKQNDGIWVPARKPQIENVLKNPNHFQNRLQFHFWWTVSKLIWGNAYILKVRNESGNISRLYVLDSSKVTPLVSDSSEIFYQINTDKLNQIPEREVTVPASEIIHDRMNCLFHPLVGVSPLYASGLAASHGLEIEEDSKNFFSNGANPGGLLLAPGNVADSTVQRLKDYWQNNFTGSNRGKIAVLGDNLKYEQLRMTSHDAQMIEQLKWDGEIVCSAFNVPAYKVGIGTMPTHDNIEALNIDYYTNCLQIRIEEMEALYDYCFALPTNTETRFDIDGLIRMDSEKKIKVAGEGVKNSVYAPNEARQKSNLPPKKGGDSVYMQQQNYSLEALAQRDSTNPLTTQPEPPQPSEPTEPEEPEDDNEEDVTELALMALNSKNLVS